MECVFLSQKVKPTGKNPSQWLTWNLSRSRFLLRGWLPWVGFNLSWSARKTDFLLDGSHKISCAVLVTSFTTNHQIQRHSKSNLPVLQPLRSSLYRIAILPHGRTSTKANREQESESLGKQQHMSCAGLPTLLQCTDMREPKKSVGLWLTRFPSRGEVTVFKEFTHPGTEIWRTALLTLVPFSRQRDDGSLRGVMKCKLAGA